MAGRPRKPTAILEASGAFKKDPKRKRARAGEPVFSKGVVCGSRLTGAARKLWDDLVEQMDACGMLQRVDSSALEAACIAYQTATQADRALEEHGLTYNVIDQAGNAIPKARPEVAISRGAWTQYKQFCTEFGLTPASRSRIATADKAGPQKLSDVLDDPVKLPDLTELGAIQ